MLTEILEKEMEKEKDKKEKKDFFEIENETQKKDCAFIGSEKNYGRRGKQFTLFLEGEPLDSGKEDLELIRIDLINPNSRKMTGILFNLYRFLDTTLEEDFDELMEKIMKHYGLKEELIDRLTFGSLQSLQNFVGKIIATPSKS